MSEPSAQQYRRLLKQSLPTDGMRWKSYSHILRSPSRDRRVVLALRERGVLLRARELQLEFCGMINTATNLARRGVAQNAESAYDFVLAVRRGHRLGRHLTKRLFVELFRALINGRRRFIRREGAETATCALAEDIDRFLRSAGGLYSDSELFLQLNEEPAEDA